ncbi:type II toxin-antitoxin system VapC family toxin [Gemmatimonas sp.]|uniref:type II toxin-antitoxin system VapC family toxin n=1 Tax=Gemmatimonas sp. TaxID=1962908 RepID=UPI003569EF48
MRVLLDTHVLIWWDSGARLSSAASKAIRSADEVFVSSASAWEIAIKVALGKISGSRTVASATEASAFTELPVLFRHAEAATRLPSHHRDPFDRMLIAQAQVENLVVISRDDSFTLYDVKLVRG